MTEQIKQVNNFTVDFADIECSLFEDALGDLDLNTTWTSIEWKTSVKKGHVYGGTGAPVATKRGRRENSLKLKMRLEAWDLIKKRLAEKEVDPLLTRFDLTLMYGLADETTKTVRFKYLEFTEDTFAMDEENTDGDYIDLEAIFPGKPEEEF